MEVEQYIEDIGKLAEQFRLLFNSSFRLNELYANIRASGIAKDYMGYREEFVQKQEKVNVEAYGEDYKGFYYWAKYFYNRKENNTGRGVYQEPLEAAFLYTEDLIVGFDQDLLNDQEKIYRLTGEGAYDFFYIETGNLEEVLWDRFKTFTIELAEVAFKEKLNICHPQVLIKFVKSKHISSYFQRLDGRNRRLDYEGYFFSHFKEMFNIDSSNEVIEKYLIPGLLNVPNPIAKFGPGAGVMLFVLSELALPYYTYELGHAKSIKDVREYELQHQIEFQVASFDQEEEGVIRFKDPIWLGNIYYKDSSFMCVEMILLLHSIFNAFMSDRCFICPLACLKRLEWYRYDTKQVVGYNYKCQIGGYVEDFVKAMADVRIVEGVLRNGCCITK